MPSSFGTVYEKIQSTTAAFTYASGAPTSTSGMPDLLLVDTTAGNITVTLPAALGNYSNASNGNAIFLHRSRFSDMEFRTLHLTAGNKAVVATARPHGADRVLRISSVHLDDDAADESSMRAAKFASLLSQLAPSDGVVDLIGGDLNDDTVSGALADLMHPARFSDALTALGNTDRTHPFSASNPWWLCPRIDHILVRGLRATAGVVHSGGVWRDGDDASETRRLEAALCWGGSDHFPVSGTVTF